MQLTEAGERQAAALGRRLARESLSAVYSSPRERARSTAAAVAQAARLEVEVATQLDEIEFGDWTGASFDELAEDPLWKRWNAARGSASPPKGEPMTAVTERMVDCIDRISAQNDGPVALVGHCDPIRGAIAHYLGLPLDNILRFDIDPASVSTLEVGAWGARVTSLNEKVTYA